MFALIVRRVLVQSLLDFRCRKMRFSRAPSGIGCPSVPGAVAIRAIRSTYFSNGSDLGCYGLSTCCFHSVGVPGDLLVQDVAGERASDPGLSALACPLPGLTPAGPSCCGSTASMGDGARVEGAPALADSVAPDDAVSISSSAFPAWAAARGSVDAHSGPWIFSITAPKSGDS